MPNKTALLVIDMQRAMFETPGYTPYNGQQVLDNIIRLINAARAQEAPVVYIQHTAKEEGHPLVADAPGWPLHPSLAPRVSEPVVRKSSFDAFLDTNLAETLTRLGATNLVICGMQTQFCVDTTTRSAFAHNYTVTLASDAHTTFDTDSLTAPQIITHHNETLNNRFCTTTPSSELFL